MSLLGQINYPLYVCSVLKDRSGDMLQFVSCDPSISMMGIPGATIMYQGSDAKTYKEILASYL
jgi:hypothetical protein